MTPFALFLYMLAAAFGLVALGVAVGVALCFVLGVMGWIRKGQL